MKDFFLLVFSHFQIRCSRRKDFLPSERVHQSGGRNPKVGTRDPSPSSPRRSQLEDDPPLRAPSPRRRDRASARRNLLSPERLTYPEEGKSQSFRFGQDHERNNEHVGSEGEDDSEGNIRLREQYRKLTGRRHDDANDDDDFHDYEADGSGGFDNDTMAAIKASVRAGDTPNTVYMLLRRVNELEARLADHERGTDSTRREIRRRMEASEVELRAAEVRHEELSHELEENYNRFVRTEQYLDTMRRDVVQAVGRQRWRVMSVARSAMNNVLYYFIAYFVAYLVPMFMFLFRGGRGLLFASSSPRNQTTSPRRTASRDQDTPGMPDAEKVEPGSEGET